MAQMGVMGTASIVAATMAGISAVGTATTVSTPFITLAFQAVGLGILLALPALLYETLLIIILAVTALSSYLSYRFHRRVGPFGLALVSSLVIYSSIYLLVSEPLYWSGFALMIISAIWNQLATRLSVRKIAQIRI